MMNDTLSPEAIRANIEHYQALADKAKESHIEYLRARNVWQKMLDSSKKVDKDSESAIY